MDNITGATVSGASRLSFAQKVVASGMSLVLAFGLSPLGQAPAYAAENDGGNTPITAAQTALQTQEGTWANAPYAWDVESVNYDGTVLYEATTPGKAESTGDIVSSDKIITSIISIWHVTTNDKGKEISTAIKKGPAQTGKTPEDSDWGQGLFGNNFSKYEYLKDGEHTDKVQDAGNYTLVLYGVDYNAKRTIEIPFTVKPIDLSKAAEVTITKGSDKYEPVPNAVYGKDGTDLTYTTNLSYKGKGQTIEYIKQGNDPIIYPTVGLDTDGDKAADKFIQMKAGDFAFTPSLANVVGDTKIELKGLDDPATDAIEGNFTNSWKTYVSVTTGEFAAIENLTVNGAINSAANANSDADVTAGKYVTSIDLTKADKNPTVLDPDPVADGKVIFGETTLAKNRGYDVTYFESVGKYNSWASAAPADQSQYEAKAMPTALGNGYVAVIEVPGGDNFSNAAGAKNRVVVYYSITGAEELDKIAAKADFGSVSFVAESGVTPVGGQTIKQSDYGVPTARFVAPTSGTFTSEDGTDVSSSVGSNWRVLRVSAWDDDMERAFLGEEAYAAEYGFSDNKFENTQDAIEYVKKNQATDGGKQLGYVKANEYVPTSSKAAHQFGFDGLPAGVYQLTVEGTGIFKGGEVSGKFTVAPATAVEGTAVGQLDIAPGSAGYDEGDPVTLSTSGTENKDLAPRIRMVTGIDKEEEPTYSPLLKQGNAYEVRTGQADYYVTYKQNGETVTPAAAGTYDAEFTFGGNDFASDVTITKAAALTIGTPDLQTKVGSAVIETTKDGKAIAYQYTGYGVEPTVTFYKENVFGTSAADYTDALTAAKQKLKTAGLSDAEIAKLEGVTDYTKISDQKQLDYAHLYNVSQKSSFSDKVAEAQKVTLDKSDYTMTYTRDGVLTSESYYDGKPAGIGTYAVNVWGAGEYVSSKNTKIPAYTADFSNRVAGNIATEFKGDFVIEPLDLTNTDVVTVQFSGDDGATWQEYFSTTMGGATKVEPKYRIVTTASKSEDAPNVIDDGLYSAELSNNDKVGEATLTITNNGKPQTDNTKATSASPYDVHFYIALGTFADANAAIKLTNSTAQEVSKNDDGKYSSEYAGVGKPQDVVIHVEANGSDIAAKEFGKVAGDYVWTLKGTNGKEITSSDKDGAATALAKAFEDVGTYTITVHGASGLYAGELETTFTITPKEIKQNATKLKITAASDGDGSIRYDGTQKDAGISVAYDGTVFSKADDLKKAKKSAYVISGNKGVDANTYTATIEFGGNYTGTVTKTWKIKPINLEEDNYIILADDKQLGSVDDSYIYTYYKKEADGSQTLTHTYDAKYCYNVDYNGQPQRPTVTVYDAAYNPIGGLEYTYQYDYNTNASRYSKTPQAEVTIIASGGNYTGRVTKLFMINGLALDSDRLDVTFDEASLIYTGKPIEPTATLKYTIADGSVIELKKDVDYEVSYSGARTEVGDAGTAKFTGKAPNFVNGEATFVNKDFTVQENNRTDQKITVVGDTAITKKVGDPAFKIAASTNASDGKVEFASSDPKVATVDESGNVTIVGKGNATITITSAATKLFNAAAPVEVKLTVTDANAAPAAKSANTLKIAKATYKVKGVSKAKKTVAGAKVKVKGQGNVTWKKVKVLKGKKAAKKAIAKKIVVKKKTGKIVLKKGLKKGTYKVTVSAKAAGDATHDASKVVKAVVTLKVKK